jgi:hypothetical protein
MRLPINHKVLLFIACPPALLLPLKPTAYQASSQTCSANM